MVTWQQLASVAGIILGLALTIFGTIEVFAMGMSDVPADNENPGCWIPLAGVGVLAVSIAGFWL